LQLFTLAAHDFYTIIKTRSFEKFR